MNFEKENILVKQNLKKQKDLFDLIAKLSFKKNISSSEEVVVNGFLDREKQGTTGFEEGFAIPHARVSGIKTPAVFVITNENKYEDWDSLDQKGVQYAIALLIPEKSSEIHMNILSSIATKLMDQEFKQIVKTQNQDKIFEAFNKFLKQFKKEDRNLIKKDESDNNKNIKRIVGISACPAGIAHTFMAKKKIEDASKKLNYEISWETQGANIQKNKLTSEEIEEAEVVIIASDIDIDLKRFIGKKVFITSTNEAIKEPTQLIQKALQIKKLFDGKQTHSHESTNPVKSFFSSYKKAFQSNFGTPWSYLFITASLVAIISLIGFSFFGQDWAERGYFKNKALFQLQEISKFALYLSMPFMAGNIARSMSKKPEAFLLVFIATFLINIGQMQVAFNAVTGYNNYQGTSISIFYDWNGLIPQFSQGSNIIGAVATTFITVLIIQGFYKIKENLGSNKIMNRIQSLWMIRILPTAFVLFGVVFLLGLPLAYISSNITWLFFDYGSKYWYIRFLIGGLLGVLISIDLGGFINKTTLIALVGLAQYDLRFTAIISIGIPIGSLGFGSTFYFFKNKFKPEDKWDASTSFQKGIKGISEGPLNALHKYGWRVQIPNLVSSFIATGFAFVLGFYVISGGLLNILYLGGQAHLAQINDISFLNQLLPRDRGILTIFSSIAYGILGYYFCIFSGCISHVVISSITFSIPGNKRVFKNKRGVL